MTNNEKSCIDTIIQEIADRDGVSVEAVRQAMQEAIDEAWASMDFAVLVQQMRLFPAGKPCPEEFISTLVQRALTN